MKVGLIGAGRLGEALGARWAKAGHEVMVGSRSPERGAAVAARLGLGTTHGTPREAATHGDAVLLGVRWADLDAALEAAGPRTACWPARRCWTPSIRSSSNASRW